MECLKCQLDQLEAVNEDLKTSLSTEQLRTREINRSLEKERERTALLSNEIVIAEEKATSGVASAKREAEEMR